jgi:type II secretory pathway component PulF
MGTRNLYIAPSELLVEYYHRGEKHRETIVGTENEIRGNLVAEGKVVLKISKPSLLMVFGKNKVDSNEVFAVFDTLGDLLLSNIPLSRAIDFIISSFYSKRTTGMKKILNNVSRAVKDGKELSTAMAAYTAVFGNVAVGMVIAGEGSGRLTESLKTSAHYIKVQATIRKEMIKNLTYPVFLLVFGMVALLLNANVIIPKIIGSEMFSSIPGAKENIFIKILKALSYIVPSILGIIAVACSSIAVMFKVNREKAEALLFGMPVVREFFLYRNLYLVFHSLAKLIEVGVKIDNALDIVKSSTKVVTIRQDLVRAQDLLRDGKDFAMGFNNLSQIEKAMLSVSFSSEKLRENLEAISQRFYNMYVEKTSSLAPKIYGTVLVVMAVVFILIFMGIAIPYSQILKSIK